MITSETMTSKILSPVREIQARVELYEGSTLVDVCNCHDKLISFDVQRVGDTSKFFGFGICQRLNFHLIDKNREMNITTAYHARVAFTMGGETVYPFPKFYVTEVHRDENTNELSVTAYDALKNAEYHTTSEVMLNLPLSILDTAIAFADFVEGVDSDIKLINWPEDDRTMFNHLPILPNFGGAETMRQAFDDVAEATYSVYYLDNTDTLCFKRLKKDEDADLAITKDHYFTLSSKTNRRLAAICRATELGDNVTASIEASGTTQYVRDNAFWDNREDIADVLNEAIARMGGFTINQFDCSWRGNFLLEIGDKIDLTTKDNGVVCSYIIDDTISYDGSIKEKTAWTYTSDDAATDTNPTTIGEKLNQTFAKVDKMNATVELVASRTENIDETISSIKLNNDRITATVENIDKEFNKLSGEIDTLNEKVSASMDAESVNILIETALSSGAVDTVVTKTGFSFKEDGLTIEKSDSDISTVINEDGMNILRGGSSILVADSKGVMAEDLHATTYLLVGENSRFESYKTNRTGCFWIGQVEEV